MQGLFPFELEDGLDFIPLAARRAFDLSGVRLSLEGWRTLSLQDRESLVALGASSPVEASRVRTLTARARPEPGLEPASADEDSAHVPAHVVTALGADRPLDDAAWRNLDDVGRFALSKLARRDRAGRLGALYDVLVRQGS